MARQSPALIVAMLALFVALTGTAVATTSALIGSAQIRNNSITGLDVKNRSLRPIDFRGSVRGPRGLRGLRRSGRSRREPARTGDKGDKGDTAVPVTPIAHGDVDVRLGTTRQASAPAECSARTAARHRRRARQQGFYTVRLQCRHHATASYLANVGDDTVSLIPAVVSTARTRHQHGPCPDGDAMPVPLPLSIDRSTMGVFC